MEAGLDRRTFISAAGASLVSAATERGNALWKQPNAQEEVLHPFHVTLPHHPEALPFGTAHSNSHPAFAIRGIKGWAWSPEQYLAEIPVLARYRLNFLMNDYGSLWELGPQGAWAGSMNYWYRPLPAPKREAFEQVIRSCHDHGITFCFSMNPNLKSDRSFDYDSTSDLDTLWNYYEWAQRQGVTWFNVSLDDIHLRIDAAGQARLVNEIYKRLRSNDSRAQMVFCPTWYAGTGDSGVETGTTVLGQGETPGVRYTRTIARLLHEEVYLYWTGPQVCSLEITAEQARSYKTLSGHRILIWDNYPVNDQRPTLHLGPLTGRSSDLYTVCDGFISNPMSYQNEANRIPLLTVADYLWNPKKYDPTRSIAQSIYHLGDTEAKRKVLRDMVELYPGRLWDHSTKTGWNSLQERFDQSLKLGRSKAANQLIARAKATLEQAQPLFPDSRQAGVDQLSQDINMMLQRMGNR